MRRMSERSMRSKYRGNEKRKRWSLSLSCQIFKYNGNLACKINSNEGGRDERLVLNEREEKQCDLSARNVDEARERKAA